MTVAGLAWRAPLRAQAAVCACVWAALAACAAGACGHAPDGPGTAATAFGDAIERGDLKGAYGLTSAGYQKRTPYEAFAAAYAADPPGAKAYGARLRAEAGRLPPRVELQLSGGETVPLVLEEGRWRIDAQGLDPWGQTTPRAALGTFIRALDLRRYDVVLRLVPNRYRGELTADKLRQYWEGEPRDEHLALLARLRAAAGAPIIESGDEAHMPYGEREVRFVREDGRWKIERAE